MLKRKKQIIAKVMATTMLASTLASTFATNVNAAEPQTKATVSETTISGDDRYKTAVEISKNYSSTSKHAVIVNGQKGIVDALTATPYASLKKAPILMTQSTKLNEDTKKELTRRGVKTVDIVGGVNSVSDSVKAEIEAMGITVNRIAGNSKYETALKVAKEIDGISDISKIAVANGEVLADAVSVAAPAAQNKMPIILAHPTKGLDAETKKYIDSQGVSKSYVIGGTSSVSTTTQNSLPGTKKRLEGTNRQGTNASVIKEFYTSSSYDNMYVAKSGQVNKADEIADALAVGVLAASNQDPVMLVGKSLGSTQKTLLESKDLEKITKVGGNIPTASIDAIKNTQSSTKTVTTVAELKAALANAKDGDIINFNPSGTVSEAVSLSTTKNVTVNLNGTHSGAVSVDMANGTLNINGNVSNKVSVDAVKAINVSSGKTVKELVLNSGAKNATVTNKGTITTATVSATGVTVTNSGTITTLNSNGDTTINNTGTIGNMDASNVVASISSPNAKQVVIRFNKSIDKNSIIDTKSTVTTDDDRLVAGVVTFKHTSGTNDVNKVLTSSNCHAELSSNGMSLTITAPNVAPNIKHFKGNYTIEIDNVTSNGIKQEKYTGTLNVNDTIAPSVSEVKFNASTNKFEVSLSEPIEVSQQGNLVMTMKNNISIAAETPVWNVKGDKFTFTRPNGVNLGENIKVYIDGLKDAAGNAMQPYTNSSVSVNNTTLSVSVTQPLDNKIRLTFNKDLQPSTDGESVESVIQLIDTNSSPITGVAKKVDSKTYDIELSNVVYESNNRRSFKLKIDADKITDITGVKNTKIEQTITLNKDTIAPTITSTKISPNNAGLEVTLSEDVTILDANKIKLFKGNGISVAGVGTPKLKTGTSNVIQVNLTAGSLADGTYQVKFEADAIKDLNTNKNKAMETSKLTVKNTISTDYKVTDITSDGDRVFTVKYTGDIDDEKISYKNFTLNNVEIHDASTIMVNNVGDDKTITVTLPAKESIDVNGNATFKVSGLTLKSGQVLADKANVVTVRDNTSPVLTSAKASIDGIRVQLKLTFSENLQNKTSMALGSTIDTLKDELVIKRGSGTNEKIYNWGKGDTESDSNPYDLIEKYSVEGNELTIVLIEGNWSNLKTIFAATNSNEISIEVKQNKTAGAGEVDNIKDAFGNSAKVDVKVTTSSKAETIK